MANSDNVLRGGLTPKHIDVEELLAVLEFTPTCPAPIPVVEEAAGIFAYKAPTDEFALWRVAQRVSSASCRAPAPAGSCWWWTDRPACRRRPARST